MNDKSQDFCCLCRQIAGREDGDLIARMLPGRPYVRRVILESSSFAVLPSLGPLVPGHCLICPKEHLRSFSALEPRQADELDGLKNKINRLLKSHYGFEVHLFEHGMASEGGRALCTLDHAHLHLLPLSGVTFADGEWEGWRTIPRDFLELRRFSHNREYLFYQTPDGVSRIRTGSETDFESQFLRQVIARKLGRPEIWNWRDHPDPEATHRTWEELSRAA